MRTRKSRAGTGDDLDRLDRRNAFLNRAFEIGLYAFAGVAAGLLAKMIIGAL